MPFAVFILLVNFAIQVVRVFVRKARDVKPQPLCADCFYAHVQYGANGRRAISCVYGGVVRPMKLDVLYCTDYLARTLQVRNRIIGFVREIAPAE